MQLIILINKISFNIFIFCVIRKNTNNIAIKALSNSNPHTYSKGLYCLMYLESTLQYSIQASIKTLFIVTEPLLNFSQIDFDLSNSLFLFVKA